MEYSTLDKNLIKTYRFFSRKGIKTTAYFAISVITTGSAFTIAHFTDCPYNFFEMLVMILLYATGFVTLVFFLMHFVEIVDNAIYRFKLKHHIILGQRQVMKNGSYVWEEIPNTDEI
jgi:hypothetical protein